MKTLAPLILFLIVSSVASGQISTDSLQTKLSELPQLPDSVKASWQRVDSVRNNFNAEADSIQGAFNKKVSAIDAQRTKLNATIDSLNNLNLPTEKYTGKLDSLNDQRRQAEGNLNGKLDALKSKTIGQLSKIELTPEMQGPVSEFTQKINGFNLQGNDLAKLPPIEIKGFALPTVDGVGDVSKLGNLKSVDTPLGDLGSVTSEMKGLGEDAKNIASGNLDEVKNIDQSIEKQALKIDGMEELQKQSGIADGLQSQVGGVGDVDALKQQGLDVVKQQAIDHFAGKDEVLKAAMEKVAKYKRKYSSVSSLKDLPKGIPNAMKGKPLIERIVPGMYFQYQQKNQRLFDVNPYAGYRISGRFTAGLGWNQRFAYDGKKDHWVPEMRVFGPRTYFDTKFGKGFIAHIEGEYMNTYVPNMHKITPEPGGRQWVFSLMAGLKREYTIYRNLQGTVLLQYNFANKYFKTPYVDKLNSRIGFEYKLRKKPKLAE